MSKKKRIFEFGDIVKVYHSVQFGYYENNRIFDFAPCSVVGRIIGATYRFLGKYEGGSHHRSFEGYGFDDYDSPSLVVSKVVFVWQVKTGMTNKVIEALEEDLVRVSSVEEYKFPWRFIRDTSWTDAAKESLRKEMETWPRDSEGRWIKK